MCSIITSLRTTQLARFAHQLCCKKQTIPLLQKVNVVSLNLINNEGHFHIGHVHTVHYVYIISMYSQLPILVVHYASHTLYITYLYTLALRSIERFLLHLLNYKSVSTCLSH